MKQKNIVFLIAGVLFLVLSFVVYSWDEPGEMPSAYNSPINTGTERQYKNGEIGATVFRDINGEGEYYIDPSFNSKVAGTITGADPVGNSDFATKGYVDGLLVDVEEELSLANMIYVAGSNNPPCPSGSIEISRPDADSVICARVGEPLYGNAHTVAQCHLWGGEVVTVESDNKKICRLNAAVCPGGFVQYRNWSTTSPSTVSLTQEGKKNDGPLTCSCTTGSHTWGDKAREGCQINMGYGDLHKKYYCETNIHSGSYCGAGYYCNTPLFNGESSYIQNPWWYCHFLCGLAVVNQIGCY